MTAPTLRTAPRSSRAARLPFREPGAWHRTAPATDGQTPCAGAYGFVTRVRDLDEYAAQPRGETRRRAAAATLREIRTTFCDVCPLAARAECRRFARNDVMFSGVADGRYWSAGVAWASTMRRPRGDAA